MTNETQQSNMTDAKQHIPFGTRLKSAREDRGLERKDVAAQLRLNEKFIIMMEKDRYPADLPTTFIRGYLRSYAKFLEIPEYEVKKGIEPIKPRPVVHDPATVAVLSPLPLEKESSFMQLFTYLIVIALLGLAGLWWYSQNESSTVAAPVQTTAPETDNAALITNGPPAPAASEPAIAPTPGSPVASSNNAPNAAPAPANAASPNQAAPAPKAPPVASSDNSADANADSADDQDTQDDNTDN